MPSQALKKPQTIKIEIAFSSIVLVIATLVGVALVVALREILLDIFLAFIFASALGPILRLLQRHRVPQAISLAGTFLLLVAIILLLGLVVLPNLIVPVESLFVRLPQLTSQAMTSVLGSNADQLQVQTYVERLTDFLTGKASAISSTALQLGIGLISGFISFVTIVVISFYMIVERPKLFEALALLLPYNNYMRVRKIFERVEYKLGSWLRGQLFLGLVVGLLSAIGLTILQVPYVLPLSVIAGVLELLPIIGPIVSAVPAVIIALAAGNPSLAIAVVVLYVIIQQLEAHLIVPKVMERAVGLNPLIIIISLITGGALMGILGAFIAVPVAVVGTTILEDIRAHEREVVDEDEPKAKLVTAADEA